jgi:hypothetical protein
MDFVIGEDGDHGHYARLLIRRGENGSANIRKCVTVGDGPAIEKLDPLVTVVCLMANHIAAA